MSAVLRHIRKHNPHWKFDYQAEEGKHQVGRGIADSTFAYGNQPDKHYDAEVLICLYDTWANWGDRPNTRVSSCLHEHFGLAWDAECARYQINVSNETRKKLCQILPLHKKIVAIHYRGDSSPERKNLTHEQGSLIAQTAIACDHYALMLDWRKQWPIAKTPFWLSTGGFQFSQEWGASAEMNAAVISQCRAFVGIDSGPGKCASATDTPSLIVWTGHHPAPFHDPAPNTTHLVPEGYHGLEPVCNDKRVIEWFEAHYNVRTYRDDPIKEVQKWLREILTTQS